MTFITVKYGDNEQKLFNPYCSSLILLECIRKNCNITDADATLDLSDALGSIKRLPDNLHSYANTLLDGRETYWVIKVEKGAGENDPTKYTLLIDDPEKNCPELSSRLQDLSRPTTRGRRESQWSNLRRKLPRNRGSGRPKSNTKKR
ncbi:uncharacterized protein CXorf65 homolog [Acanthaster planci]|uniref:Uncharacterized protein CXorf65 homolog n=1 Tax=Acanthaster planci TaxID=133434 RepID=A0A8B7YRE5_ACAPL|nr:uncharacterized protein CXorf65 homolog [Acanthaster planci]